MMRLFLAALASALFTQAAPAADAPGIERQIERAIGESLQGDAAAAVRSLTAVPSASVTGENAELRKCMLGRFAVSSQAPAVPGTGDAWMDSLATAYQSYWHHALSHPDQVLAADDALRAKVATVLGRRLESGDALDAAEADLEKRALEHGFHVLLGRTPPLREFMAWKTTVVESRPVALPDGPEVVRVNLLQDFVLRGWGHFATCGQRSAGGWANDDGLFAVVPAYRSVTDETFNVRFVAHEGQHYADKRRFKDLEPWELEYRGKLAEFALADESQQSTRQLICENQGNSKESAHGYANTQVVRVVSERLKQDPAAFCHDMALPGQALRDAARTLLLEDTAKR